MIRTASNRLISEALKSKTVRNLSVKSRPAFQYDNEIAPELEEGVLRSPYKDVILPNCTVDQYVWSRVNEWGNKVATVCGVTNRFLTYAQLRDHSRALAVRLQTKLGLKHGNVIAVCIPNCPEFPIAALGPMEAGCILTTLNPIYSAEEISRQLMDSKTDAIIGTVSNIKVLQEACNLAKRNIKIICLKTEAGDSIPEGTIDFNELISLKGIDLTQLQYISSPDSVALLPYSSGTTGLPKGVELTHRNLTANFEVVEGPDNIRMIEPTTKDFQDSLPCVVPFFHISGFSLSLMSKLAKGCKLITLPKFTPESFLNALANHKGTVLHLVPPIVNFLAQFEHVGKKHTENIRSVMSGAAPLGKSDAERFLNRFPNIQHFVQGYGLTETSPMILIGGKFDKSYDSVGHLIPNTEGKIVALDDPKNKGLGVGEVGELLVRGPQIMKGYHNNKKATDETFSDGWLRTGDLAYYDDKQQFFIADRLKELIKVKGYQVPPAELECVLRDHPDVADAGVIGVTDLISGEVPRAFIVKKKGSEVTEKELQDYVAGKVAKYKWLAGGVKFLDVIPKNASGKILRKELKDRN